MVQRKTSLKDKLSRLEFIQACKLLGPEGKQLIMQGGKFDLDFVDENVFVDDNLFQIDIDWAQVTIKLDPGSKNQIYFGCSQCRKVCEHIGAAFALILEEKTLLGLAKPPPKKIPAENLNQKDLIAHALKDRQMRAETEPMEIESMDPAQLWTNYRVTNSLSGKSYRVALRGWSRGDSYCSCPDFRKNTLGTCKHIMRVQKKTKARFDRETISTVYKQKDFAVHILYGKNLELRFLAPPKISAETAAIIEPVREVPIKNVHTLLQCIRRLEASGHPVIIYPDAQEYIEFLLHRKRVNELAAQIRKNPAGHPLRKTLLKTELLPYQLDGIAFVVGAGRAVLADDMGLGKTIQGIGAAELLSQLSGIKKVLVICPASLKSQWRSEILRFSDLDCRLILGSAPERAKQYENDCFFTICNYEQVLRDIHWIEKAHWDYIIIDEGQRIKNWEAKTSRIIKSLNSRFALVLSGTPLENRLDDLFSVVEFVDDRRLGPSFQFFHTHRVVDEKGKLLGYKNMDQLRKKLKPILLRRTRSQVSKQLPSRSNEIIRIPPTDEQYELNQAHKRIIQTIINKPYISEMDLLRLQKALLICRMAADSTFLVDKKPPGFSSKIQRLQELLEDLNGEQGRKILLFSEWTTMLDLIEPILEKLNMDFVRLDGSVPQKKRALLVHQFQEKQSCKLFITTNAGATGLNLQAANTVINVDLPWNPAVLEQRIARAHRMGQKNPVQVYILVTEDTLEEGMLGTLAAKKEVALASLDINSDLKEVDMSSGAEELKRRMEILLGRPEDAPLDMTELEKQKQLAEKMAQKEKVAAAASQLFASAFNLLDQILPQQAEGQVRKEKKEAIKTRLQDCVETDEEGKLALKLKLPDQSTLDDMAEILSKLIR